MTNKNNQTKINPQKQNKPKKKNTHKKTQKDPNQNYVSLYTDARMHTYFKGNRKQPMWSIVLLFDMKSMYCVLV